MFAQLLFTTAALSLVAIYGGQTDDFHVLLLGNYMEFNKENCYNDTVYIYDGEYHPLLVEICDNVA